MLRLGRVQANVLNSTITSPNDGGPRDGPYMHMETGWHTQNIVVMEIARAKSYSQVRALAERYRPIRRSVLGCRMVRGVRVPEEWPNVARFVKLNAMNYAYM